MILFFAVISLVLAGILNVLKRSHSWNRVRTFVIVDRVYRFSFHNSLTILPVTYIYMKSFFISTYKIYLQHRSGKKSTEVKSEGDFGQGQSVWF